MLSKESNNFYERLSYFTTRVNKLKEMGQEDIAKSFNATQMKDPHNSELLLDLTNQAEEVIELNKNK